MSPIVIPLMVLSGIGLTMAAFLAVGRKVFAVEVDERHERILDILPGANCGGCGYPGCSGYATGLIEGSASPTGCPPGGADLAHDIGKILGVDVGEVPDDVAVVACAGDMDLAPRRANYLGVQTCDAAHSIGGGDKQCESGCLGLASCQAACPFDAIEMTDKGLAVIIPELCTGCGGCVSACPRDIIKMVPRGQQVHVLCNSPLKAKAVKAACNVGCTGCKLCTKQSALFKMDGALAFVDGRVEGEIPDAAAFACGTNAILDTRRYSFAEWTSGNKAREDHLAKQAEWKAEEKKRKQAAKEAKAAKAAAQAETKNTEAAAQKGGAE